MGMMGYQITWWPFHLVGMLFWLVIGAAVASGLVRWALRPHHVIAPDPMDPLTEAKRRLARGEISPDQYEEIRAHLRD
jgi:uncharacterized membrane protein